MIQNIDEVTQRAYRYWFVDGFTELVMGGLDILVAMFLYAVSIAPPGSPAAPIFVIGMLILTIGGAFIVSRILRILKERVTYPRTGYVAYRKEKYKRGRWMVVISMFILGGLLALLPDWMSQMPFVEGVIACTVFIYFGYRFSMIRFYVLAAFFVLLGAMLSLLGLGDTLGTALFFGLMGVALLVSGGITLWIYLSRAQPPVEEFYP